MTNPMARLTAALADRYRIERELGAGGMATVFLAQDIKHDRKVAVKVLRPELAVVIGAERFLAEIKTTANLQHPHILPLFDSGEADSFLFYVMPYVEGISLRDRIAREHQLPINEVLRLVIEVAGALDYAHRHGVIHRDIKPENILLHDGSALVADFGIALAVSTAGSRMTETGMSLGTPHYMAPEQAMGERELTPQSDVYALGAMTYEMLAGEPPFTGPTAQAIVAKVMTSDPEPLIPKRRTVTPQMEDAVLKALEKLPADRYATAAEFSSALADKGETPMRRAQRSGLSGWKLGAAFAGVAIVGIAAGALLLKPAPASIGAPIRFSISVRTGDIDFGPGLDIAGDGTDIVFIGRLPDGRPALYRRTLSDAKPTLIAGTEGAIIKSPTLSPDGRMVAFTSQSQLRIVPLTGGPVRVVADSISPTAGGLSWGAGDLIVFQRGFGGGLMTVSANGGKVRALTTPHTASRTDHRWPQVLPGGEWVVFTTWGGGPAFSHIAIASLATGKFRDLLPGTFARYTGDGHLIFIGPGGALQRVQFDLKSGQVRGDVTTINDSVQVNSDGTGQFAVARNNGTFTFFHSLGRRVLTVVDRNGSATVAPGVVPSNYSSPRYAPSGKTMVMEDNVGNDIWLYDFSAGTFSLVTDSGGFYPVWTPDGSRIYYSRDETGEVNIYTVPVNRSESQRLVIGHQGQQRTQDLSHDGKHLLIRRNLSPGQYDLLVLTLDSSATPVPWLAAAPLQRAPAFSPNDRWVAYSSNESGRDEIYVRQFTGSGGRIPVSSGGGTEPGWSHDGTELFFRTGDALQAVKVDAGTNFRLLSRPATLFTGSYYNYPWARQYDVSPDGKHFLFLRNETPESDLTIVVNWLNSSSKGTPH